MFQIFLIFFIWQTVTVKADSDQKWDRLVVNFGKFINMPKNEVDAKSAGWIKDGSCDGKNVYVGNRYLKNNDKSTRLIFGNDGVIAGIQATIAPTSTYPGQSSASPWIRVNENEAIVTVYFRNPHTICDSNESLRKEKSTFGHELYIQTKSWLDAGGKKAIRIPKKPNQLKHTLWMEGKCFPKMGIHYWYNISTDTQCKDIYPIFLLYDVTSQNLKAFGWSVPVLVPSTTWERPPMQFINLFLNSESIPKCLKTSGISTQHVYLTDPTQLEC